eukprot:XP_011668972.1 PREDICTED: transketolase-like [Strongylocentrotus purpuratus]
MAYTAKYFDKADYRTYCLVGDGESAEGSIWEACAFASYYKLDNLVAIFDVNRLGQSQPASLEHQVEVYQKRLEAFGYVDRHRVKWDTCCKWVLVVKGCWVLRDAGCKGLHGVNK